MQYVKGKSPQSANTKLLTVYDGVFLRITEKNLQFSWPTLWYS